LAIRERLLGPDDSDVSASLNSLPALYGDKGEYANAEACWRYEKKSENYLGLHQFDCARRPLIQRNNNIL
jgi:hypothetical protein